MKAVELNIDVVYEAPYWVALFEKVINNRRSVARKRIGKEEPKQSDLSNFFANLNYKNLRYTVLSNKQRKVYSL